MRYRRNNKYADPMWWAWRQKEIMIEILWRDEFTCQLCGSHRHLQIHHIEPRSKGGDNSEDNLLTLCRDCHDGVHHGRMPLKGTGALKSGASYPD